MSLRTSDQRIEVSRSFALYWMLSLVVPLILALPVIEMIEDVRIGDLFLRSFYDGVRFGAKGRASCKSLTSVGRLAVPRR